jgi:hypothetical protein
VPRKLHIVEHDEDVAMAELVEEAEPWQVVGLVNRRHHRSTAGIWQTVRHSSREYRSLTV